MNRLLTLASTGLFAAGLAILPVSVYAQGNSAPTGSASGAAIGATTGGTASHDAKAAPIVKSNAATPAVAPAASTATTSAATGKTTPTGHDTKTVSTGHDAKAMPSGKDAAKDKVTGKDAPVSGTAKVTAAPVSGSVGSAPVKAGG